MAEEHPAVGRVKVLAVVKAVGRRDPRVVENRDPGRQKRAVIPVGDRQNAQHNDHHRHRVNSHCHWSVVQWSVVSGLAVIAHRSELVGLIGRRDGVLAPDCKLRLVILEEPDFLFDPQLLGQPVGDQVIHDLERRRQEIGSRYRPARWGCGR